MGKFMILECNKKLFDIYHEELRQTVDKFYKKNNNIDGSTNLIMRFIEEVITKDSLKDFFKIYLFIDNIHLIGYGIMQVCYSVFGENILNLWQLYCEHNKLTEQIFHEYNKIAETFAIDKGCGRIELNTTRKIKSYSKWIKKFGFQEFSTSFIKKTGGK